MDWFELAHELEPGLRRGDLDSCLARAIEVIEELPKTPFHKVVELEFTNSLNEVEQYISSFLNKSNESVELKSLYTETNGFDINSDEWYFELFGYASYGGHEDYDWLCEWQTESENRLTLTGMESLQQIYDSDAFGNKEYDSALGIASLIVVLKFQKLIRDSARQIEGLTIPLLATSHDYDFIYEYSSN